MANATKTHDNREVREFLSPPALLREACEDHPWLDDILTGTAWLKSPGDTSTRPLRKGLIYQVLSLCDDITTAAVIEITVGLTSGRLPLDIFPGLLADRKEARAAGHQTFFGGYKCLKGHLSPRLVRNARCCNCIELEKAKEDAAYVRGLERGRAPEVRRKEAEKAAKERLKEEQRKAKREEIARVRDERARERANDKRKETIRKKVASQASNAQQDGSTDIAPWN